MDSTIEERILLNLSDKTVEDEEKKADYYMSQKGISEAVDGSISRVSRVLREMRKKNLVKEEKKYLKDSHSRRKKTYYLTSKGLEKKNKLRERLMEKNIKIYIKGEKKKVKVSELDNYIENQDPILYATVNSNENNIVTLSKKEKNVSFIDREEELEKLKNEFEQVKKKGCSILFIVGEAGTGKTALAKEFKKNTETLKRFFLEGRAYYKTSDPYLPFKNAFQDFKKKSDEISSFPSMEMDSTLKKFLKDKESFDAERQSVFFDFSIDLKNIAEKKPLIIFLDDLHWSDKGTLQLLNYLVDNLQDSPVFFICAFRPESITEEHPLKDLSFRLSRKHAYKEITLNSFEWEYTKDFLHSIIPSIKLPLDFVDFIQNTTEGNPLFIEEYVDLLEREEKLPINTADYPTSKDKIEPPQIVEDVFKRRLKRHLSKEGQKISSIGSVIGTDIPFKLLLRCSDMNKIKLSEIIDELIEMNIWREIPDKEVFQFTHKLMSIITYEKMSETRKKRLHEVVAKNIEDIYTDKLEEFYSDLGHHYMRAGDIEKAISYYLKAGKRAEEVYALEEAINLYKKGLSIAEGRSERNLLENLGEVYKILGKYESAIERFELTIEKESDDEQKQRIFYKLGECFLTIGDYKKALQKANEGLSLQNEENNLTCKLLSVKGKVFLKKGQTEKAKKTFYEERKTASNLKDEEEIARANHNISLVYMNEGNNDKAKNSLENAVQIRERSDHISSLSESLNNLGIIYERKGKMDKALEYFEKTLEIEKEIGRKSGILKALNNVGIIYNNRKNFEKALDYYQRSFKIAKKTGDKPRKAATFNNIGHIYYQKGCLEKASEFHKRSLELRKKLDDKNDIAMSLNNLAVVFESKDEFQKALNHYEQSLHLTEKTGNKRLNVHVKCGMSEIYIKLEEYKKANELIENARYLANELGSKKEKGTVYKSLGKFYRENKNYDKSKQYLKKAKNLFEEINDEFGYYQILYEEAILFQMRKKIESAIKNLKQALDYFEKHNMKWWAERCRNELYKLEQ